MENPLAQEKPLRDGYPFSEEKPFSGKSPWIKENPFGEGKSPWLVTIHPWQCSHGSNFINTTLIAARYAPSQTSMKSSQLGTFSLILTRTTTSSTQASAELTTRRQLITKIHTMMGSI